MVEVYAAIRRTASTSTSSFSSFGDAAFSAMLTMLLYAMYALLRSSLNERLKCENKADARVE